jgi:transcriptional regulator with XRE-family HTH domain
MAKQLERIIEPIYRLLGGRLRLARELRNITQREAAQKMGVGQSVLSNMEMGYTRVGVAELVLACEVLGVPIEKMVQGIGREMCALPPQARAINRARTAKALETLRKKKG